MCGSNFDTIYLSTLELYALNEIERKGKYHSIGKFSQKVNRR